MRSGYLLRDVINKVAGIHFTANEELHTLGALYESMLREMRDAAGDSGEFYTPRPVVRFMVEVTDPQLGETVLDPAAGTGGFLVEAFNHLSRQVKTVEDRRTLQERSLFGCEPKSLPYLLCQMNLLLHGLDAPRIDPNNALRFKLSEIGEKDRVDVILTNPPFGGAEEKGVQGNFPDDLRTTETSLLFMQLIVRRLHRRDGRGAIVVPDGFLSNPGVAGRIRKQLLEETDLYAIIRLPFGVFEPYTPIKTNILFFKRGGSTDGVWFYEVPIADGRKKYTKTRPLTYEELGPCLDWLKRPSEGDLAWHVTRQRIESRDYSLDFRNPTAVEEELPASPKDLSALLVAEADKVAESARRIKMIVASWEASD